MENPQEQPPKNPNDNKNFSGHQVTSVTNTTITSISSPPTPPSGGKPESGVMVICTILGLIIAALGLWYQIDPKSFPFPRPKGPDSSPSQVPQINKKSVPSSPIMRPAPPPTIMYVTENNVNMVAVPGAYSQVLLVLSKGDSAEHLETRELGEETWVRVRVQTNIGSRIGWINRRYISFGKV